MNSSTVFGIVESVNSSDADSTSSSTCSNENEQFRQQVSDYVTDFTSNPTQPIIPPPLMPNVTSDAPLIDMSKATISIPSFARNPMSFDPFSSPPSASESNHSNSLFSPSTVVPQYSTPLANNAPQYVQSARHSTNINSMPKSHFGANSQIDILSAKLSDNRPDFNATHTHFGIKCVSTSYVHYTSSFKELCEKLVCVPHPVWLAFGTFSECSRWLWDDSRIEGYTTDHIDSCPWIHSPNPTPPTPTGLSTQELINALSAATPSPQAQSTEFVLKKEKSKDFDLDNVNLTSHSYKWYDLKKQISVQAEPPRTRGSTPLLLEPRFGIVSQYYA